MLPELIVALALSAQPQATTPAKAPAPTTIAPDAKLHKALESWTADLTSSEPGVAEEATIQLAHAGLPALQHMETKITAAAQPLRTRIKSTVNLMLIKTITPDELSFQPNLSALCRADFAAAEQIAANFDGVGTIKAEGGLGPNGPVPIPDDAGEPLWSKQLAELGGFAAPGIIKMCRSKHPAARYSGVRMIVRLGMTAQTPLLESLRKDTATTPVFHGCFTSNDTIESIVERAINNQIGSPRYAEFRTCLEVESYFVRVMSQGVWDAHSANVLINRLRSEPGTFHAVTWDEYWEKARPLFRQIVRQGPPVTYPRVPASPASTAAPRPQPVDLATLSTPLDPAR